MSDVERFSLDTDETWEGDMQIIGMSSAEDGEYVRYADYEKLRAEIDELKRLHQQEFLDAGECTPAERAVLDAMAKAEIVVEFDGEPCEPCMGISDENDVCRAELARRGEKP